MEENYTLDEGPRQISNSTNWTRSDHGVIAGVCAGLSRQFDINVGIIRLAWLASIVFFGTGLLLYLAFWIALPRDSQPIDPHRVFGVCYRISRKYRMDVGLVRLLALLLTGMSLGATLVGYLVLHVVLDSHQQEEAL